MTITEAIDDLELQKHIWMCTRPYMWSVAMELALQALKEKADREEENNDQL